MAQRTKPLPYKEFAEHIDEHLDALEEPGAELTFQKGDRVYNSRTDAIAEDIWANYDAERLKRTIETHRYNGLPGVDIEELKRDLRAARGQESHGRPA